MTRPVGDALASAPAVAGARIALEGSPGEAWIVGGAIRNALLDERVADADLAVEPGREEAAARAIAKVAGGTAFALSTEHATWRAVSSRDGWHLDVAALRADSIEADLRARDFTVNAIGIPLEGGEPIDPTGGMTDADARVLRAASDQAFEQDPLRLLRAPRLAAGHALNIDPATMELARAIASRAAEPAGERQFSELRGMVGGRDPVRALALMNELGLTPFVLPAALILKAVRRIGTEKLPFSRSVLLWVGVFPIRNHYYEPLFDARSLRRPLEEKTLLYRLARSASSSAVGEHPSAGTMHALISSSDISDGTA